MSQFSPLLLILFGFGGTINPDKELKTTRPDSNQQYNSAYPFQFTEYQNSSLQVNLDSAFSFYGIEKPYPIEYLKYVDSVVWREPKTCIPDYQPMELSYFYDQLSDTISIERRVVLLGSMCYNLMTNQRNNKKRTVQVDSILTLGYSLDEIIGKVNRNEWIGQCGEFDALASVIAPSMSLATMTMNPYLVVPSLNYENGHIMTLVYSEKSELFYPIDIQSNCYWRFEGSSNIADLISILKGKPTYRVKLDSLNGGKMIHPWPLIISDDNFPIGSKKDSIKITKFKDQYILRIDRSPPSFSENVRKSYLGITAEILKAKHVIWEDFIFNAGILNLDGTIKTDLFYSRDSFLDEKLLTQFKLLH